MDGTVNNALHPDSGMKNKMHVFAQPQEQCGILQIKHVIAHQDFMVLNVLPVLYLDNGKIVQTCAYVLHLKLSGTKPFNNVNVLLDYMDQNVNNVHYQENGMIIAIPVIVLHQLPFGIT